MELPKLNSFSDLELINKLKTLKENENGSIAEIVLHLYEVDTRQLYRDLGYSCLFKYCTEGLAYSVGGAYRRIQAARALKDNPEVYTLLKEGKLTLCAVSEISKVKEIENKSVLFAESQGKSKTEVQKMTARYSKPVSPRKTKSTPRVVEVETGYLFSQPTEESKETKLTFTVEVNVDEEFMELLEKTKIHMGPIPVAEVFRRTMKSYLSKKEKKTKVRKAKNNKKLNSRYIPRAVRHEVSVRDNYCCSFIGSDGKRCSEKMKLQVDHIKPYALGGDSSPDNLRLLCPSHNLLMAERSFGKGKIKSHFHRGSDSRE